MTDDINTEGVEKHWHEAFRNFVHGGTPDPEYERHIGVCFSCRKAAIREINKQAART